MSPDGRSAGLDAVRGLAAAAVVLLHSAYAHALLPLPGLFWPVPLDDPSLIADAAFWWIEGSAMPLFFSLGGYCLARSLAGRTPGDVFRDRTRRLLKPMALAGPPVLAAGFAVWVSGLVVTGRASAADVARMRLPPEAASCLIGAWHLWFVWYLWLMSGLGCGAAAVAPVLFRAAPSAAAGRPRPSRSAAGCPRRFVASAVAVVLTVSPEVVLGFQHRFRVHPPKFAHGLLFVALGTLLRREPWLQAVVRRYAPVCLAAAGAAFAAALPQVREHLAAFPDTARGRNSMLGGSLAEFGAAAVAGYVGSGLRWLDRPGGRLGRLAEASFWIYLTHPPVVGLLALAARPAPLPPAVKAFGGAALTLAACLSTYGRFVRGTALGRLFDGGGRPSPHTDQPACSCRRGTEVS